MQPLHLSQVVLPFVEPCHLAIWQPARYVAYAERPDDLTMLLLLLLL
jgi:hypothetical protein